VDGNILQFSIQKIDRFNEEPFVGIKCKDIDNVNRMLQDEGNSMTTVICQLLCYRPLKAGQGEEGKISDNNRWTEDRTLKVSRVLCQNLLYNPHSNPRAFCVRSTRSIPDLVLLGVTLPRTSMFGIISRSSDLWCCSARISVPMIKDIGKQKNNLNFHP
jgi:hypothetical protein